MYQYGYTPLLWAATFTHLPVVEYLVEQGADAEARNKVCDEYEVEHTLNMNM